MADSALILGENTSWGKTEIKINNKLLYIVFEFLLNETN